MSRKLNPAFRSGFWLVSALLLLGSTSGAQSFDYTQIDVPCAACPRGIALSTSAQGINPAGDVVGAYTDSAGHQHGFLLSRGEFTTIDVPGMLMGVEGILPTAASAISPSGDIIGTYIAPVSSAPFGSPEFCSAVKPASCIKGFLYSRGKFSTVLFPLTPPASGYHPGAVPHEITPNGDIYGCFHDYDLGMSMFGAVWTRLGDFSLTAAGGELAASDPLAAPGVPMSMNNGATPDGHTIVGHWADMANHTHGFIVQNGEFHAYDVPSSKLTVIWDINPTGAFVGVYTSDKNHGFLQLPDGSAPITIDFPANPLGTQAISINPSGSIVGQYTDSSHHLHGFLAVPLVSY
jgi:uncharacterized membrane protein